MNDKKSDAYIIKHTNKIKKTLSIKLNNKKQKESI